MSTSSNHHQNTSQDRSPLIPRHIIWPFILVTSLFALWGFANDVTNPMVAAFKKILLISHFQSSLVQFAFYGGYCVMAIPAALFIRRFSYKAGIILGLFLYASGALLFIPAGSMMAFSVFLISYFILTCGLSFLETSSNPYVLSMGSVDNATQRLNFSQSFNPIGSLTGMFVAQKLILARLDETDEEGRRLLLETAPEQLKMIQKHDLAVLQGPYVAIGVIVLIVLAVFLVSRFPKRQSEGGSHLNLGPTLKRLFANEKYMKGVLAQAFYVGVQIMCWTFIIQYAENELGMKAEQAQGYNIVAMAIFCTSRFICTYLLRYISPGKLLSTLAACGGMLILGTIFLQGMTGLYCLVAVSACMSLMFPTIYGIALKGLGEDAKLGAAGLIMAIGGGSIMPPLQAYIMDQNTFNLGFMTLSSTRASFVLPLICFVVIVYYGIVAARNES
ncbi:L-fucose:H+ symporter permease [bacterium]|nr:L-fucose:H+ symporter permease [bacterium]